MSYLFTANEGTLTELTFRIAEREVLFLRSADGVFLAEGIVGGIMTNKIYPASFLHTNIAFQDPVFEAATRFDVRHLFLRVRNLCSMSYKPTSSEQYRQ